MSDKSYKGARAVIHACGGEITGRIRLQKLAYLAEKIGKGFGFEFEYYRYGPFSHDLAQSIEDAKCKGHLEEQVNPILDSSATYSIFKLNNNDNDKPVLNDDKEVFLQTAKKIKTLPLELLATALFLQEDDDEKDPWEKLRELKPSKASNERIKLAYEEYCNLQKLSKKLKDIEALPKIPEPI